MGDGAVWLTPNVRPGVLDYDAGTLTAPHGGGANIVMNRGLWSADLQVGEVGARNTTPNWISALRFIGRVNHARPPDDARRREGRTSQRCSGPFIRFLDLDILWAFVIRAWSFPTARFCLLSSAACD
jgi:hypothetical protein